MLKTKMFQLSDVKSNPYRDLKRIPLNEAKLESLVSSIKATDFWEGVQAREVDGKAELAFGHHRIEAARKVLGKHAEVPLLVGKFSDAEMIQRMGLENAVEYGTLAGAEHEVIEALFEAFRHGKLSDAETSALVALRRQGASTLRVVRGIPPAKDLEYSTETVAAFLGWPIERAKRALSFVSAQEDEGLDVAPLMGLSATTAQEVVREARARTQAMTKAGIGAAHIKHEVKEYVREAARKLERGEVAVRAVRTVRPTGIPVSGRVPPGLADFLKSYTSRVNGLLTAVDRRKLEALEEHADLLELGTVLKLTEALRSVAAELVDFAKRIELVSRKGQATRQRLLEKEVRP